VQGAAAMKLPDILDNIYTVFRQCSEKARLILMHPESRYRTPFIARLTRTSDYQVFYYALGSDDVDLPALLNSMTHDLSSQNPLFGRHLHLLHPADWSDREKLAQAACRDIAALSSQPFLLILDEYDRSQTADDIQWFIERLVASLPEHCRIVINSRSFPRLPWVSMIARQHTLMLNDNEIICDNFYDFNGGEDLLEVYALGPGFVLFNEKVVDIWEGHLPRLLFFFALDRPVITRSEICHAFWPDLDVEQAVNVFHVTKRRLHKALGEDVLVHHDGYYRINPSLHVEYDVMRFVTRLIEGRIRSGSEQIQAWQDAIDLYRGPFLQGHTDPWILTRRADFRTGYLEAVDAIARERIAHNLPEHALILYRHAIEADPLREDMHCQAMRLYQQLGRRSEAIAQFRTFENIAARNGLQVSAQAAALYNTILNT
jgi:DNA-binding SARP family transcriptional activator